MFKKDRESGNTDYKNKVKVLKASFVFKRIQSKNILINVRVCALKDIIKIPLIY